ncbi:RDD family protein [Gilvimarinus algae]|uniref:RDD family protein n=1 Tax=Gilvimarinus algae TaxID=3058037 RepID=A0ABT8TF14_9GAMM|nr:RDD family protein [Gilvimarinus sp. SDUM040014]MDO3382682.1 RDD family protein [Gilvimarinus sp. SDUM040014]
MNQTQNTPPVPYPSAGLGKRLAAWVYDFFLLFAVSVAYGALVLAIKVGVLGEVLAEGEKASLGPLGFIGWLMVLIAFYCLFWRRFGQTLGMKAWRLKITDTQGEHPSIARGALRCVLATASMALLGLGYLWLWFDPEHLTLHDRLSGTRVWQLPKGH